MVVDVATDLAVRVAFERNPFSAIVGHLVLGGDLQLVGSVVYDGNELSLGVDRNFDCVVWSVSVSADVIGQRRVAQRLHRAYQKRRRHYDELTH